MTEKQWKWIDEEGLEDPKGVLHLFIKGAFREGIVDLLNEQQSKIKELEKENDDLRTTITKQVEAITEMKDIIYMLQDLRIGDYSSTIEEDMQELKKAYDGTLEDFLNYFKED